MTLGILSWKAHRTLKNTLESYKAFGLDKLFSERIIYFQEIGQEDKDIANKYGYKWMGTSDNVGIAQAYKALVEKASEDIFLFLENDWVLLEHPRLLIECGEMLLEMGFDVIRYRHQKVPGWPLWTLQFKDGEYERPTHLLDAVHWTDVEKFPEIQTFEIHLLTRTDDPGVKVHGTTSKNANWTNNPTMFRTDWLREHILPRIGSRDAEVDLQPWWEQQDFHVAYLEPGLFTHRRIG